VPNKAAPAPHAQNFDLDTARLAAIIDSSDDAIVSKDLKGIIITWNRAAERMFGYTSQEAVGRSIRMIIPADRQAEEDDVLGRIVLGLQVDHFETIRQRKDGSLIPISLSISPIRDATGCIIGASKIARDISDRKEAERQAERNRRQTSFLSGLSVALSKSRDHNQTLKTLAEFAVPSIADWCAVDVLTPDGQLARLTTAHVDPKKVRLTDDLRRRQATDSPYSPEHVVRTGEPAIVPLISDALLVAAAKGDEERLAALRQLGLVSYICIPIRAHNVTLGTMTLATGESKRQYNEDDLHFVEDVASRTALAMENARAFEQLKAADRLKEDFLATLSHELRTPLNAVLGYARMLKSGVIGSEKVPQALDVIERNATSLSQIVEDVLDVSRIISGKVRLNVQPVNLATVLTEALASVQPAADAKGVSVEKLFDSHVGPVAGDPDRLQQVIWNLISNAVKFTPRGGRIQLRLLPVNSHIEIIVSDTGIGIPATFLPHIFERFRQAESGTTRRHGGLGLGLAIARHIVEMHGGTIHASSEGQDRGATFCVQLPVMIVHPEVRSESERVHPRVSKQAANRFAVELAGVRVLAVDDDPDALAMLQDILEAAGADVSTAFSGEQALKALATNVPDVLISDLGMPNMDGFELIRKIRDSDNPTARSLPAAALTAYARSEDRTKALRAGFGIHLSKPVDPGELVAAVAAMARSGQRR